MIYQFFKLNFFLLYIITVAFLSSCTKEVEPQVMHNPTVEELLQSHNWVLSDVWGNSIPLDKEKYGLCRFDDLYTITTDSFNANELGVLCGQHMGNWRYQYRLTENKDTIMIISDYTEKEFGWEILTLTEDSLVYGYNLNPTSRYTFFFLKP